MTQADLLEQLYTQISSMHGLTNKRELVENAKRHQQLEARKVDPDTFPINKLSADLVQTYCSIWNDDKELRRRMEAKVGHYLRVKDSLIEHHEAGRGVFISCRR